MPTILPVTVPGSQPTGFWVTVTTHPNVVAVKQAVSDAFERLKQLAVWVWAALANSGAVTISAGLATGCWAVRFVSPSKANQLERLGLYAGLFWVEMKGAWNRAKLEAENGQLKEQNQQVVKQNEQLNIQVQTMQAQHVVEKQVQSAEVVSLKASLQTATEREIAATPEKVARDAQIRDLRAEVLRLKTENNRIGGLERELETERARAISAEQQVVLNPSYDRLQAVFQKLLEAKQRNQSLETSFEELNRELETFKTNYKRVLKASGMQPALYEPAVDRMIGVAQQAVSASKHQANMESILQKNYPDLYAYMMNQPQQEIVS